MLVKCPRCGGIGIISSYMHVEQGICFLCEGQKMIEQAEAEKYIMQEERKARNIVKRNEKLDEYRRQTKERIEAMRNRPKVVPRHEPQEPQPYKYEGSAQEALDIFFKQFEEDDF